MKKFALFLTILLCTATMAWAQQDCPQVDCPGICGRFVDADGDGFCDHGRLSAQEKNAASAEQTAPSAQTELSKKPVNAVNDEPTTNQPTEAETTSAPEPTQEAVVAEDVTDITTETDEMPSEPTKPFRYPLFTILGITLGLYLFTFILVKTGKISKPTHRKIWNVTLGITCLGSCLIGLLLAFLINYGYRPTWYVSILHWHVYLGIAMTLIAIFHIFWHVEYFKAIFKSRRK